jgi:hypothetical protein
LCRGAAQARQSRRNADSQFLRCVEARVSLDIPYHSNLIARVAVAQHLMARGLAAVS